MTPDHMHKIPSMEMHRETADSPDESMASFMSEIWPVIAPYIIPIKIKATQRILSMNTPYDFPGVQYKIYDWSPGIMIERGEVKYDDFSM